MRLRTNKKYIYKIFDGMDYEPVRFPIPQESQSQHRWFWKRWGENKIALTLVWKEDIVKHVRPGI